MDLSRRSSKSDESEAALLTVVPMAATVAGPVAPTTPAATAAPVATAEDLEKQDSWSKDGQPCVLLVMHNTTERLLMKHLCQAEGCVVDTSDTGLKALQMMAANKGKYALCLMDTVLSDVGPSSLCSQMLELELGGACCGLINQ